MIRLSPVKFPSLYLNFLYGKKSMPHADIAFIDDDSMVHLGVYFPPQHVENLNDNYIVPQSNRGLLCINISSGKEEEIVSTICHEFRHHIQHQHGINFKYNSNECGTWEGYADYFLKNPQEWDALMFERSKIDSENTSILLDYIIKNNLEVKFNSEKFKKNFLSLS